MEINCRPPVAEASVCRENCRWVRVFSAGADALSETSRSKGHGLPVDQRVRYSCHSPSPAHFLPPAHAGAQHPCSHPRPGGQGWSSHDHCRCAEGGGTTMCLIGSAARHRGGPHAPCHGLTVRACAAQGPGRAAGRFKCTPELNWGGKREGDCLGCAVRHTHRERMTRQGGHFRAMHRTRTSSHRPGQLCRTGLVPGPAGGLDQGGAGLDSPTKAAAAIRRCGLGNVLVTSHYSASPSPMATRHRRCCWTHLRQVQRGTAPEHLVRTRNWDIDRTEPLLKPLSREADGPAPTEPCVPGLPFRSHGHALGATVVDR